MPSDPPLPLCPYVCAPGPNCHSGIVCSKPSPNAVGSSITRSSPCTWHAPELVDELARGELLAPPPAAAREHRVEAVEARAFACMLAAGISARRNASVMQCAGSLQSGGLPNAFGPERRLRVPPVEERAVRRHVDDEIAGARVALDGQRHAQLDAERAASSSRMSSPHIASGRAPQHLADQVAERDAVVAVRGAGLPPRRLRGERGGHRVPVAERTVRHAGARSRGARLRG